MEQNGSPLERIKQESKKLAQYVKLMESVEKKLNTAPYKNLAKIKKEFQKAVAISNTFSECQKSLSNGKNTDVEKQIKMIEEQAVLKFANTLKEILKKQNIVLTGKIPDLWAKFYQIKIDPRNLKVSLFYGHEYEKIGKFDMDADKVAKIIAETDKMFLKTENFRPDAFIDSLFSAYKKYIKLHDKKMGESVPIKDFPGILALEIQKKTFFADPAKKNFREYSKLMFAGDLYKLRKSHTFKYGFTLVVATRAFANKHTDFIWIPSNEKGDGEIFSHIKFKEENNG